MQLTIADKRRMQLEQDGRVLLNSPEEGLWSIATDWKDGWPSNWRHADPESIEAQGPWTIVRGRLETDGGAWILRDAYRAEGPAIRCVRRWTWTGEQAADKTTLAVRWQIPQSGATTLIPGNCYYGNPSGVRTRRGVVPQFDGQPGARLFIEEHRCPMPFASLEWSADSGWFGAALHSLPSPAPHAKIRDQWWSLGVSALDGATEMALLSGPCAMNGQDSVVKGGQGYVSEYLDAWLNVPPGHVIEKTFFIEAYPVARQGDGFRTPIRTSVELFQPLSLEGLPAVDQILEGKYRFAMSRWYETENAAGYRMFPGDRKDFVMGWCGQAEAPGYAQLLLHSRLGDPEALSKAQQAMDHLASSPFNEKGFHLKYIPDTNEWKDQDNVSQGQAMGIFARAIRVGRGMPEINTERWEAFLRQACDLHAERIMREDWRPVSTNEGFYIEPLCAAYALFGEDRYRKAALKAAEHYAARHLDMTEPYWGGTLDASCEDKEGAWAAFQGFLAVYEMTGEARHLDWAGHAMDVALSYTVVWNIVQPPGRLADHALKTRGWSAVSVQNHHLDVFGIIFAPEVHRMGELLQRGDLKRLALVMYRSCGQLIDPFGSQGEQVNQTNYVQHQNMASSVYEMRGTYSEGWTVFWMTAHFLTVAAKFQELGVEI
ncbi:hypothetical protein JXA32_12130 [Candidatus Sumerlaeota bacterium]|nr:hypothetical protein [Candidatus Sumerlaeota bacterium]